MTHAGTNTSAPLSTTANASLAAMETRIAWAGWELPVPAEWRPLKVTGDQTRGEMMLGDAVQPLLLLRWWQPAEARDAFDAEFWLQTRFRNLRTAPAAAAPCPAGITHAAWALDIAAGGNASKSLWYGYAPGRHLVLELVLTSLVADAVRAEVLARRLPQLRVTAADGASAWALFSVGFMSPPGFTLVGKHLYAGDIALRFARGTAGVQERLLLRQVYPATLALARRTPQRWLEATPFREARRLRGDTFVAWNCDTPRALSGWQRHGWKRLRFPLGRLRPRHSTALIATDPELDRLLIAEHDAPADAGLAVTREALLAMNQPGTA